MGSNAAANWEWLDRLRDTARTPRAVLGIDATSDALSDDRVDHLFLADTLPGGARRIVDWFRDLVHAAGVDPALRLC